MTVLVRAENLTRHHRTAPTRLFARAEPTIALDGVDLELREGATLGIIGESGSGKSTLVRLLLALDRPTSGSVWFDGRPWMPRLPLARCGGCDARPAWSSRTPMPLSIRG